MIHVNCFENSSKYDKYAKKGIRPSVSYIKDSKQVKFKKKGRRINSFEGVSSGNVEAKLWNPSVLPNDKVKLMKVDDIEVTPNYIQNFGNGDHTFYVELSKPLTNIEYLFGLESGVYYGLTIKNLNVKHLNVNQCSKLSYLFTMNSEMVNIEGLESWDVSDINNMEFMFALCYKLTSLNGIKRWDVSNVTNMYGMFGGCTGLTSIDLSNWDVSSVTDMTSMFGGCTELKSLDSIKDWDTSNVTNMNSMFHNCNNLTSLDSIKDWDVSNVTNMSSMFSSCAGLTSLDLSNWDTIKVTNMNSMFDGCTKLTSLNLNNWEPKNVNCTNMFYGCSNLVELKMNNWKLSSYGFKIGNANISSTKIKTLDLSTWDVSSVTDMSYMFYKCTNLTSIDISDWDVSNVVNMSYMFSGCTRLISLDLSNWDTSKVTYMSGMFMSCSGLTSLDLTNWDTGNVTDMGEMFRDCKSLTSLGSIKDWDTSKVINMNSMFSYCRGLTSLDLSNWDTSKVTNMNSMFKECRSLTSLDSIKDWDTSKVTTMHAMFNTCSGLTSLDLTNWDTSNVIEMSQMFYYCTGLTSLDLSNWDISNVTSVSYMFYNCYNLSEIRMGGDVSKVTNVNNMFNGVASTGTFYYNSMYDYSKIIEQLPSTWAAVPSIVNISATELSITAEDVNGRKTTTTVTYTLTYTGNSIGDNSVVTWLETGTTISDDFGKNLSETDEREVEISFTYKGFTATTTITQGVWVNASYAVDLNSQWQLSTSIDNPDFSLYEGVYESFSNKGANNSAALMYIDIVGYTNFKFYVRSYAESNCDYVVVSNLDCELNNSTISGTNVKMTTSNKQYSGTTIGSYTLVEFTGIDEDEHRITVMYRKDGSVNSGTDQGYVLIPKDQ